MSQLCFSVTISKLVRLNIVIPDIYNPKVLSRLRENHGWDIRIFCNYSPKAKKYIADFIKKHPQIPVDNRITYLIIRGVANILMAIKTMISDKECVTPFYSDEEQHLIGYCEILDAISKDLAAPAATTDDSATYVPVKTSGAWPEPSTSLTTVSTSRKIAPQLTHTLHYMDKPSTSTVSTSRKIAPQLTHTLHYMNQPNASVVPSAIAASRTMDLATLALLTAGSERPTCLHATTSDDTEIVDLAIPPPSISDEETDTAQPDTDYSAKAIVSAPPSQLDAKGPQGSRDPLNYLGIQFTPEAIALRRGKHRDKQGRHGFAYTSRDPNIRLFESLAPDPDPTPFTYSDFIKIFRRR